MRDKGTEEGEMVGSKKRPSSIRAEPSRGPCNEARPT